MGNAKSTPDTGGDDESKIMMFNIIVTLKSFKLLTILGKGAFGKVRLVELRKTGEKFALKYVIKKSCIERKSTTNVFRERIILQDVCHPLIINLKFAFQGINNH
jgi:serine/threonine kinase 32